MQLLPDDQIHATLVALWGAGLLLTGPSGSGKSSLAWGLLQRGHALVVDDSPCLFPRNGRLYGQYRAGFEGLIHLPDRGLCDVRRYFGPAASLRRVRVLGLAALQDAPPLAPDQRLCLHGVALERRHLARDQGLAQLIEQVESWARTLIEIEPQALGSIIAPSSTRGAGDS
ncbi:MAG: hypothetical protein H7842_07775 [Gammaproteobacteria bacterium SHHR-1]|uniref:hypothetical protein n=1 Tax=Magnetovirga frankeli TaxID=947516 RepID=UPI001AF66D3D|nr:hypothetical protein D5125_04780 [gamma proteobacterium SS-5]